MIVSIYYEKGKNSMLVAACDSAIQRKFPVSLCFGNLRITVDEFRDFLNCIWHGFYEASRGSQGWAMRKKYYCVVMLPSGKSYHVWFRYILDNGGIAYGSYDPV